MQDQKKVYGTKSLFTPCRSLPLIIRTRTGFTISLYEYPATIPTLWNAVKGEQQIYRCPSDASD